MAGFVAGPPRGDSDQARRDLHLQRAHATKPTSARSAAAVLRKTTGIAYTTTLSKYWNSYSLFSIGLIRSATNITERTVEFTEEGARRNPDVATLNGLAPNLRGLLGGG